MMTFLSFPSNKFFKLLLTILLALIFSSASVYSQVKIKERVGINSIKQSNKSILSKQSSQDLPCGPFVRNNSADTLTQIIWTGSTFPIDPYQQPLIVQNNTSVFRLVDSYHYDVTIIEGTELAGFHEYSRDGYDFTEIGSSITNALGIELRGDSRDYVENCYWGENLGFIKYYIHFSDDAEGGTVVLKILQKETGDKVYIKSTLIKETFKLATYLSIDSLKHNYASELGVQFLRNECPNYCTFGVKPKINRCTFEITSGSEFGVLRDGISGGKKSSLVTENISYVSFMANGVNPDSSGYVTIRITPDDPSINPIEISFQVLRNDNPPPGIVFEFDKNFIAPGDTVNVTLKFRKLDNTIEDFLPNQLFDVGVYDGGDYGILYSSDMDSYDYTFYDVRNGFRFIANESISVDSAKIILNASAKVSYESIYQASSAGMMIGVMFIGVGDTEERITGMGEITIGEELALKINLTGRSEIWPYKAVSAGYNPITNVKIKVTNGDQPQANQSVKITITRIERSGGHDHPNSSDLTLWGRISINGVKGNPVTAYTDQNGEITTEEIRASEFGGEYLIEASLESKPGIKDKVSFIVKVPGLNLLPENSSYIKTGGTEKHFGPPIYQTDNNHWVDSIALSSLVSGTVEFLQATWNRNQERMRINDIGLPFGGLFDINGTWRNPHISHRTGKDVDIENGNRLLRLQEVLNNKGWAYIPEGPGFYPHFRFNR